MSPGKHAQRLNALLHREPLSTFVYCLYWIFILSTLYPIAVVILALRTIFEVVLIRSFVNVFAPVRHHPHKQLAIVVTGCDSGFGKELVVQAASAGFTVFAGCLHHSSLELFRGLPNVEPRMMDVTNNDQVLAVQKSVQAWLDQPCEKVSHNRQQQPLLQRFLHAVVNNAGIGFPGDLDWTSLDRFQKTMDVNYFGTVRCTKAFLPILKQQSLTREYTGARILNIVSMAGLVSPSVPLIGAYTASKAATQSFSDTLCMEMAPWGIQVASINPSFHQTPMIESIQEKLNQTWDQELSKTDRDLYGSEYKDQIEQVTRKTMSQCLWKMDVVVETLIHCLTQRKLPMRVLIGIDSRFAIIMMRALPTWLVQWSMQMSFPRPVPAVLQSLR